MKYTILVIEDEKPLLNAIQKKLELSDFEVLTARSVDDAMRALKEHTGVRALWLDHYLLGKESGLDFVARLKESSAYQHLPIFVVSNTASPEKVQSYLHLGVNKYYTKSDNSLDQIIADIQKEVSR